VPETVLAGFGAASSLAQDGDFHRLDGLSVSAALGGFLAAALFGAHPLDEFFDISTWLTAIVGSILLLAIYRVVVDRNDGRALQA
jgi:divalent metal cation (Fe/Co/Zn/Cd) transporter